MVIVASYLSIFFISAPLLGTIKKYSLLFVSLSGCFRSHLPNTIFNGFSISVYPAWGWQIFETIPGVRVVWKAVGTSSQLMQTPSMTPCPVASSATCSCCCSCTHIVSIWSMFSLQNNENQHRIPMKIEEVRVSEQLALYPTVGSTLRINKEVEDCYQQSPLQYCQINLFPSIFLL